MVITLGIPDAKIQGDVRELTGKKGKIVLLSLESNDKEALEARRRYDLKKPGAVLTDEFGNVLKGGMKDSEQIMDAYCEMDELMADMYQAWTEAIREGKFLIQKGRYFEAARVLKVFAFASGTKKAEEGKRLFENVAEVASEKYEILAQEIRGTDITALNEGARKALIGRLADFIGKWPKTPAAFAAEDRMAEIVSKMVF